MIKITRIIGIIIMIPYEIHNPSIHVAKIQHFHSELLRQQDPLLQ